jgi:hypothetical protein
MRPGDASLGGERRVLGGRFQSPRSDGRAVGDATGEAYEGAVTPEVLTKGPGRHFGPTALGTADLGSADTQKGSRVTSRELSFYGPRYIGDATPSSGCGQAGVENLTLIRLGSG